MNIHIDGRVRLAERVREAVAVEDATPVTVAFGDGIGPEIMTACLEVMLAAGARLAVEAVDLGERVYRAGHRCGVAAGAWESIGRTGVLYKAPVTTPQGGGFESVNAAIRSALGLFANVRPARACAPFLATRHGALDVIVVRESAEDLYAGIEHRQTEEVYQCLKLASRPGTERIVRCAFEQARANGRRKVTCMTKDNVMKLTDGLFHRVFNEIGAAYPGIEKEHMLVDVGAARLASDPGRFDVIVAPNLYGDILSDIAAGLAGPAGLAPSASLGGGAAMFEAVHGAAPRLAGKDAANPSGLLLAGVMMLVHIGQPRAAERIHNAWLKTIEDGIHTRDLFDAGVSARRVGTRDFAEEVIARLGSAPTTLAPVAYGAGTPPPAMPEAVPAPRSVRRRVGVDVFVNWPGKDPDLLAERMRTVQNGAFELVTITNRGVKVWPRVRRETGCTDHWRCRYMALPDREMSMASIAELQLRLAACGVDFVKTEHLLTFNGVPGFSAE